MVALWYEESKSLQKLPFVSSNSLANMSQHVIKEQARANNHVSKNYHASNNSALS